MDDQQCVDCGSGGDESAVIWLVVVVLVVIPLTGALLLLYYCHSYLQSAKATAAIAFVTALAARVRGPLKIMVGYIQIITGD